MSEPAFPIPDRQYPSGKNGMSLRDYFAARALPSILRIVHEDGSWNGNEINAAIASDCYRMADAMIKEREK